MAIISPSGWFQNIGAVNTAQVMRLADGGSVKGSSLLTSSLAGRGGILRRASGYNMQLLQTGGGAMTVNVEPGICYVPGTEAVAQGGYWVTNDATLTTSTFTTAHASLNRIDTVYVKINDTFYSGALNSAQILIKDGTAGSGVAGDISAINNAFKIGEVTVRAGATSILTADINNNATWLTSPGGVTPMRSQEGAIPGIHNSELSIYQAVLRYWEGSDSTWRMVGIGKGTSPSILTNVITGDMFFATSVNGGNFQQYSGSVWQDWVPSVPGATLRNIGGTSIGSGSYVPVPMDWEDRDTLNGHSTVSNTSRYTAQRTGRYRVWGGWASPQSTQTPPQSRGCALAKNGVLIEGSSQVHTGVSTNAHVSIGSRPRTFTMNTGDYVELMAFQNLGSSLTTQTTAENQALLEVEYIGQ